MSLRGNEVVAVAVSEGVLLCIERVGERGLLFSRSNEFILAPPIVGLICPFGFDFSFEVVLLGVSRPFPLPDPSESTIMDFGIDSLKGELTKLNGLERRRS